MRIHPLPGRRLAPCVLSLALLCSISHAAEWSLEPQLSLTGQYDDNPDLIPGSHSGAGGATVAPRLLLGYGSETLTVRGRLEADIVRYPGESRLNENDYLADLFSNYKSTERTSWNLGASYRRDTVLQFGTLSQLRTQPETNLPTATTDLGASRRRVERESEGINPSFAYELTERATVRLNYGFQNVTFPNAEPQDGLFDYSTHRAAASLGYKLTERDEVGGSVTYQHADFDELVGSNKFDDWALTGDISHAFTETLTGGLSAGARRTSFDVGNTSSSDTGFVLGIQAKQTGELTTFEGRANHQVVPSGSGGMVEQNRVVFVVDRKLTPRWSATLLAEYFRLNSLGSLNSSNDRRLYRINPALRFLITEDLDLELAYRYVNSKFETDPEAATSNAVLLTLTYHPPKFAWSR
jgi:hypothetical protein